MFSQFFHDLTADEDDDDEAHTTARLRGGNLKGACRRVRRVDNDVVMSKHLNDDR